MSWPYSRTSLSPDHVHSLQPPGPSSHHTQMPCFGRGICSGSQSSFAALSLLTPQHQWLFLLLQVLPKHPARKPVGPGGRGTCLSP